MFDKNKNIKNAISISTNKAFQNIWLSLPQPFGCYSNLNKLYTKKNALSIETPTNQNYSQQVG